MTLKQELDSIRELVKAATPGPWGNNLNGMVLHVDGEEWGESVVQDIRGDSKHVTKQSNRDLDFIAAARSDVPKLLAVIDKLIEQRDEWIDAYTNDATDAKMEKEGADYEVMRSLTTTESKGELKA